MSHPAKFQNAEAAVKFLLAGDARVTMVSEKTGNRFTYRVAQSKKGTSPHFVKVLTGPDNTFSYQFLGTIFEEKTYKFGQASSRVAKDAPSSKAFAWAWKYLSEGYMPPQCEIWHEGRCGRCSRVLTTPESIERGLGPECCKR